MSRYYRPGSDLANGIVGRRLDSFLYHEAKGELRRGEHLYTVVEFVTHDVAICVDDYKEFCELSKLIYSYTFYALNECAHARSV